MSRDIMLGCDDCKECLWIGDQRDAGLVLYTQQPELMRELATFLVRHQRHMLGSGGGNDYDRYAEIGWDVTFPANEWVPPFWLFIALFCGCCVGVGLLIWNVIEVLRLDAWLLGK